VFFVPAGVQVTFLIEHYLGQLCTHARTHTHIHTKLKNFKLIFFVALVHAMKRRGGSLQPVPFVQTVKPPDHDVSVVEMRVRERRGMPLKDGTILAYGTVIGHWERNVDADFKIFDKNGVVFFGEWIPFSIYGAGSPASRECVVSHEGQGSYAIFRWLESKNCQVGSGQLRYHRQLVQDMLGEGLHPDRVVHHCLDGDIHREAARNKNMLSNLVVVHKEWHDWFHNVQGGARGRGKRRKN